MNKDNMMRVIVFSVIIFTLGIVYFLGVSAGSNYWSKPANWIEVRSGVWTTK